MRAKNTESKKFRFYGIKRCTFDNKHFCAKRSVLSSNTNEPGGWLCC